jgi:hypothetical protein
MAEGYGHFEEVGEPLCSDEFPLAEDSSSWTRTPVSMANRNNTRNNSCADPSTFQTLRMQRIRFTFRPAALVHQGAISAMISAELRPMHSMSFRRSKGPVAGSGPSVSIILPPKRSFPHRLRDALFHPAVTQKILNQAVPATPAAADRSLLNSEFRAVTVEPWFKSL